MTLRRSKRKCAAVCSMKNKSLLSLELDLDQYLIGDIAQFSIVDAFRRIIDDDERNDYLASNMNKLNIGVIEFATIPVYGSNGDFSSVVKYLENENAFETKALNLILADDAFKEHCIRFVDKYPHLQALLSNFRANRRRRKQKREQKKEFKRNLNDIQSIAYSNVFQQRLYFVGERIANDLEKNSLKKKTFKRERLVKFTFTLGGKTYLESMADKYWMKNGTFFYEITDFDNVLELFGSRNVCMYNESGHWGIDDVCIQYYSRSGYLKVSYCVINIDKGDNIHRNQAVSS